MESKIRLHHGDGGKHTARLISEIFYSHFGNPILSNSQDAAVFNIQSNNLAYTTDSFVVKPLFFRGGDIGKLAICGTINDLTASGASPLYITVGFIIEEGFDLKALDKIAHSMGKMCGETGASIVAGDTKVVEKGCADGIFINTSGLGMIVSNYKARAAEPGDEIIITGTIAEHGTAIMIDRYNLNIECDIISDCSPLCSIISGLGDNLKYLKLMKDPTRGGLANALCEIAADQRLCISLIEDKIPVSRSVRIVNEMLGTDPLYLACEGRMILVVKKGFGERVLQHVRSLKYCKDAEIIGAFTVNNTSSIVTMITTAGGKRILTMLENPMIPRIC